MPAVDEGATEAVVAVDGTAPATGEAAAAGEGGRRRRGRRGGRRRRRHDEATGAAALAADGTSLEDFDEEEPGDEPLVGTEGENLGTPLAFAAPTPVSGVPVTAAESDFDDLGIEESVEAMQLPTTTQAAAPPLLSTQVELPGIAPAPAPEVGFATAAIDTSIAPAAVEADAPTAASEVNSAPGAIEAGLAATPVAANASIEAAPAEAAAPAAIESAPMTADLFAGKPVEPAATFAVPEVAQVDVAAVAAPFDAAVHAEADGNFASDDASSLAATPADVAAVEIATEAELPAPTTLSLETDVPGNDARSA
jgi:ribonuclease E